MPQDLRDITIIGAGPTGLFGLFYAGMRQVSAQILDALPEAGGQLTALYPEKFIFDVAGFPKVLAKDLVKQLIEQEKQFGQPVHLGHKVVRLDQRDGHFVIVTDRDEFPTKAIVIAAGIGAFSPRRLPQACAEPWYGRGIYDVVTDPDAFTGKRVLIIGGGDTAFDWGTQLLHRAARVTIVHRTDRFRAHDATVAQFRAAVESGRAELHTFSEIADIVCKSSDDRFSHVVLRDVKAKNTREIEADVVLPMLGFVSDMGVINEWGLNIEKDEINVTSTMDTGRPGIYAAGDVTKYPGKLKLIATGFGEAATAINQAVHWIYPEKKIAPGHSSNMGLFGQKDD
jgi:ferredoxin/flavodoxin---NADP+ reductase